MLCLGCGPAVSASSEASESGGTGGTTEAASTTAPSTTPPSPLTSTTSPSTTSASASDPTDPAPTTDATTGSDSSGEGSTTIDCDDNEGGGFVPPGPCQDRCYQTIPSCMECSVWEQDCDENWTCRPRSDGFDRPNAWVATRCVPLAAAPQPVGATCEVEGTAFSGVDSCGAEGMCWNVDPDTLEGTCVARCTGSAAAPVCADPETSCLIANGDNMINLCVARCDPLGSDCAAAEGCYPTGAGFACLRQDLPLVQPPPSTCSVMSECPIGTACAIEASACADEEEPCCVSYCDLAAPVCTPGSSCVDALGDSTVGLCEAG